MRESLRRAGWRDVTLGELFEISSSKRVLEKQWQKSGVPFYRAREIVKLARDGAVENELFITEELFDDYRKKYGVPTAGDLMVSAVGTLGACYVVQPADRFYYKDASVLRFRPKLALDSRFIRYAFNTSQILDQIKAGSGSTVGTFTIERANKTRIALPPLSEQRRIAEILDKANTLRAERRAALAQLDTLAESIFLDMFGDPTSSQGRWPLVKLSDVCDRITVGVVVQPASYYRSRGVPALRSLNVRPGKIVLDDLVYFSEEDNRTKLSKTQLRTGDVVIVRTGQPGTAAVIPPDLDGVNAIDLLITTPSKHKCQSTFLCSFFNSPRRRAMVLASQRGQIQKHLNVGSLSEAALPLPPLAHQVEFSRRLERTFRLEVALRSSLYHLDSLFASLQHRAFRGEL